MFNLTLATGSVTVQGTWSNRADNCADGEANFVHSPSIASFIPATAAAGSSVTITGVILGGATAVSIAGTPGTITADTTTSVTATVPVGAVDGTLAVTTATGSATSAKPFHSAPSITSFAPNPVARGRTLTITGPGLGVAKKVTIGGKKATISSESATQILVTAPSRAVVGSIVVTSKYGTATGATVLTVN